jgi:hypothetical protein
MKLVLVRGGPMLHLNSVRTFLYNILQDLVDLRSDL